MTKQAFFISSDDLFLLDSYKNALVTKIKKANNCEVIRLSCYGNESLQDALTELTIPDLFAAKKLVVITVAEGKWHASTPKAIQGLLDNLSKTPYLTVIIALCQFKSQQLKNKTMLALQKPCDIKALPIPKGPKLDAWILAQAKKYKLILQTDAVNYIKEHSQSHLYACDQLLQKAMIMGLSEVSEAHLLQMMSDFSKYTIYDLMTAMANGSSQALNILTYLFSQKTATTLILWNIINTLKLAYTASYQTQFHGLPLREAVAKLWYQQKADTELIVKRLSFKTISLCLQQAYGLDKVVKRSGEAETQIAITELLSSLVHGKVVCKA